MGAPQVSGGMTGEEHSKLREEERQFQKEQEELRRARALEEEKAREDRARADRERIAAEEAARIAEVRKAEEMVIAESEAAAESKKKKKSDISKVSFYEALGKGVVNRPNTSEKPK